LTAHPPFLHATLSFICCLQAVWFRGTINHPT